MSKNYPIIKFKTPYLLLQLTKKIDLEFKI